MQKKIKKYAIMGLVGIFISIVIDILVPFDQPEHNRLHDYIISIILTITIWEGNLFLDRILNKKLPWVHKPVKRLLVQFPIGIIFSALVIYAAMLLYNTFVCQIKEDFKSMLFVSSIIIGTLFSVILIGLEISIQFFNQWKNSLLEVEKYKNESLQAQLQNLKNQINPHFLFNNLSVLSSLVYKDQDKAVDFITQLAKVYRFLLDNRNNELILLENELTFVTSYAYLLQIRYDKNLVFKIEIAPPYKQKLIPPMALQMLIENAIKHNEISSEQPLQIEITVCDDYLIVQNTLQLRSTYETSTKTGLQNIKDRYKHFSDQPIEIVQNQNHFIVKIPLLNSK